MLDALNAHKKYSTLYQRKIMNIRQQDVSFIEERYENEKNIQRYYYSFIVVSLLLLLLSVSILVVVLGYKNRLKEKELEIVKYEKLNAAIEEERNRLAKMSNNSVDEKLKQTISGISTLLSELSFEKDSETDIPTEMQRRIKDILSDKNALISVMFASYSITNPDFVYGLRCNGLTDREIGYCCLYASGLSGKDIAFLLNKGGHGHYNMAGRIRVKLGLAGKDTKLSVYIRGLLLSEK